MFGVFRSCFVICEYFNSNHSLQDFKPNLYFQSLWILSLINYKEPTFHNGKYAYPDWAYGIGWMFASFSLICIPAFAVVVLYRQTDKKFHSKVLSSIKPRIYECKICGEHHCEHDFPEEEQFSLEPSTPIYSPKMVLRSPPIPRHKDKSYNPLMEKPSSSEIEENETNFVVQNSVTEGDTIESKDDNKE